MTCTRADTGEGEEGVWCVWLWFRGLAGYFCSRSHHLTSWCLAFLKTIDRLLVPSDVTGLTPVTSARHEGRVQTCRPPCLLSASASNQPQVQLGARVLARTYTDMHSPTLCTHDTIVLFFPFPSFLLSFLP